MQRKYQIWDKISNIYTLGKDPKTGKSQFTAREYIDAYAPWAGIEGVKVIIGTGVINGTVFMEFEATKSHYERMGCDFSSCETDDDVLQVIENFEQNPPEPAVASVEERTAAALEAQVLLATPEAAVATLTLANNRVIEDPNYISPSYNRIKRNYDKGLWNISLLQLAVNQGQITNNEFNKIVNG